MVHPTPTARTMARSRTPLLLALVAAVVALLLGAGAAPLAAQAAILGRVVADSGGAPVAGAEVAVVAVGRSARSDALGRFRLGDLPAGAHTVVVRRIGFRQMELPVELGAGDSLEVDVALSATVQTLTPVAVEGEENRGRIPAFEERRGRGFGAFITRDELARRESSTLTDVIRTKAPGVKFIPLLNGGTTVANGRFAGNIDPTLPSECYMSIYLDGVRIYAPGQETPDNHPLDRGKGPNLDRLAVNGIEAIEIYRGPAEMPPEFLGSNSACGAIVIWTRR